MGESALVREKLVELVGLPGGDADLLERDSEGGGVGREGIEVDGDQDDVVAVGGHLAVEEDLGAVGRIEAQVAEGMEGRILASDGIQSRNILHDVPGSIPIPNADLVLLRARVLLGTGQGGPLAELEAAVDSPQRRKGGGEDRPHLEGGGPAALEP